jgi:hypothetical protein
MITRESVARAQDSLEAMVYRVSSTEWDALSIIRDCLNEISRERNLGETTEERAERRTKLLSEAPVYTTAYEALNPCSK